MRFSFPSALLAAAWAALVPAAAQNGAAPRSIRVAVEEPLVEVSRACPGVLIELRYATARNITGKPLYPENAKALLRRGVAERLNRAQAFLQSRGFGLKVWDAYRPPAAQKLLWEAIRNPSYVVDPSGTGSLHSWGAAVDVTLVDFRGREARMPTDFDAFTEEARFDYKGGDTEVAFNLSSLKRAMAEAGFRHIRDEWWHYSVSEIRGYGPLDVPLGDAPEELAKVEEPKLEEPKLAEPKPPKPAERTPAKRSSRALHPLFAPRPGETL